MCHNCPAGKRAAPKSRMLPEKPAHGFFRFPSGERVQVLYTSRPPGRSIAAAQPRIRRCRSAQPMGEAGSIRRGFGVARNMPSPLQGASTSTASNRTPQRAASASGWALTTPPAAVGYAHTLDVAAQDFCTGGDRFVGYQQPFARQRRGNLRALGRRARRTGPKRIRRAGRKRAHRSHGAGFLQIICARFMQRIGSGGAVVAQIAPQRRVPRHRFLHAAHGFQRRAGDGLLRGSGAGRADRASPLRRSRRPPLLPAARAMRDTKAGGSAGLIRCPPANPAS